MKKSINIFLIGFFLFFGLIIFTHKVDAAMVGSIQAPDCIIPLGQSSCRSHLSWSSAYASYDGAPYVPNSVFVTMNDGVEAVARAEDSTGTDPCSVSNPCVSADIVYPSAVFKLKYMHYDQDWLYTGTFLLNQATSTAVCVSGSTWNGSICAAPSTVTVTVTAKDSISGAVLSSVPSNTRVKIEWSSTGATRCAVTSPSIYIGSGGLGVTGNFITDPLVSSTAFVVECNNNTIPSVSSPTATNIGDNYATLGARVDTDGGNPVTARGTCWATTTNPTTNCSTVAGTTGPFSGPSSGTMPYNSLIYYRGYATNALGTGYSITRSFALNPPVPAAPTVTSPTSTSITQTTATIGANVTSLGYPASISARGMCYGTGPIPGTNCASAGGTTLGVFTRNITGLIRNTTYYYRGYATNAYGSGYSVDGTFRTAP